MNPDDVGSTHVAGVGVWSIVVAGGSGLRFGSRKQFAELAGQSVLQRSVDVAACVSTGVVVVVPADVVAQQHFTSAGVEVRVVAAGSTRAESVRAGLHVLPGDARFVLVHDAARPLASKKLFELVVDALLNGAQAVVPAVPLADTIRDIHLGAVDRSSLLAVQTPQGFQAATLRRAHASRGEATDDATLVEALGHTVVIVPGEANNRKLTEPTDLVTAEALISHIEATR